MRAPSEPSTSNHEILDLPVPVAASIGAMGGVAAGEVVLAGCVLGGNSLVNSQGMDLAAFIELSKIAGPGFAMAGIGAISAGKAELARSDGNRMIAVALWAGSITCYAGAGAWFGGLEAASMHPHVPADSKSYFAFACAVGAGVAGGMMNALHSAVAGIRR